jgi:hypothetical protein
MSRRKASSKPQNRAPQMAHVGWTLLVLLAALIATEMAEAQIVQQANSPRTAPQTRPTQTKTAVTSATASPSVAGAENLPIDTTKCTTDLDTTKKLVKQEIIKRIREAQTLGYEPSISYEKASTNSTPARVDARGSSQADRLAGALFAAIDQPSNAANAASEKMSGSPNRRASIEMYTRCQGDDPVPRKILENQVYFGNQRSACSTVSDMGMNVAQTFQTDMPANKVVVRFARAKMTSTTMNEVTMCGADRRACQNPENYQAYDFTSFNPVVSKEYFIKDTTSFGGLASLFKGKMVNQSVIKISPINVCGSKVYMVTAFQNGGSLGFDRSSLVGLVAPIGGKTIVLGDFSAQGYTQGSFPLIFPQKWDETRDVVLGSIDRASGRPTGGYYAIADVIGSKERPVMGEVSPSTRPQAATQRTLAGSTNR